jgi:hypothetical protein
MLVRTMPEAQQNKSSFWRTLFRQKPFLTTPLARLQLTYTPVVVPQRRPSTRMCSVSSVRIVADAGVTSSWCKSNQTSTEAGSARRQKNDIASLHGSTSDV